MKVIICGAGRVGTSIAGYLVREAHHDIVLIDLDAQLLALAAEQYDVKTVTGHAAHPDTLLQAGIKDADIMIAVTHLDEVNMVACQVAHSLFNVPKKIARLRDRSYLDARWNNLFSRHHMPIDTIISPEKEVANAILQRLSTPGTTNDIVLGDGQAHLVGLTCDDNCPLLNTQLSQIPDLFSDLSFEIMAVFRGYNYMTIDPNMQFEAGDEVYILTKEVEIDRLRSIFGHFEETSHSFVIIGGGHIGARLAKSIKERNKRHSVKVIESSKKQANDLAVDLCHQGITVINGDGLDHAIMKEAGVDKTDTVILVTNDDECNIIGGVIAKDYGRPRVISLINKLDYSGLAYNLGLDVLINPSAVTVSTILGMVRRGRIRNIQTIRDGAMEVIEAEVSEESRISGLSLEELANQHPDIHIGAVIRDDTLQFAQPDMVIRSGDTVILTTPQKCAIEIERMFCDQMDMF